MHGEKIKKVWIWLRIFAPVFPFLFLEIDRITKNHAIVTGKYIFSPHFLSFAISIEILIGLEILLVAFFAVFYCAPCIFFKTRFEFKKYFFEDFAVHLLILGSVLSNTYDITRRGGVIDWIDLVILKTNLADVGIVVGICILVWRHIFRRKVSLQ